MLRVLDLLLQYLLSPLLLFYLASNRLQASRNIVLVLHVPTAHGVVTVVLNAAEPPTVLPLLQDPGNLESCLQTGAQTGYVLLWVTLTATFIVSVRASLHSTLQLLCTIPCSVKADAIIMMASDMLLVLSMKPRVF